MLFPMIFNVTQIPLIWMIVYFLLVVDVTQIPLAWMIVAFSDDF